MSNKEPIRNTLKYNKYDEKESGTRKELEEIYNNNKVRSNGNRKKTYSKSKMRKKKYSPSINAKIVVAGMMITGMAAAVGITDIYCGELICQEVMKNENIQKRKSTMCIIESSDGRKVSYEDEEGNRQLTDSYDFAIPIIEEGLKSGYTIDEMAITVDHMGLCNAADIQIVDLDENEYYSTFLGRTAAKLEALDKKMKEDKEEKSSGGIKR